jgi:signal transduction histidine kinase
VILGYHDLLLHGDFGALAPEQSEALERANKSAEDLFHLVGGVLDLSRLGREDTPLEIEEVEAGALMREVVSTVQASGDKPSLDLFCETADTPLSLRTDRMKLRLVLGNLLGNAVKFTERGTVSLGAAEREGGIEFRVADTGIGIPAEILPVIFEPFRQGREGVDRYYGGVGLGLYIVRRLVDVLGGEISVESRVGEGSVFRVWLPNAVNGARSGAGFDPGASPSSFPAHAA